MNLGPCHKGQERLFSKGRDLGWRCLGGKTGHSATSVLLSCHAESHQREEHPWGRLFCIPVSPPGLFGNRAGGSHAQELSSWPPELSSPTCYTHQALHPSPGWKLTQALLQADCCREAPDSVPCAALLVLHRHLGSGPVVSFGGKLTVLSRLDHPVQDPFVAFLEDGHPGPNHTHVSNYFSSEHPLSAWPAHV